MDNSRLKKAYYYFSKGADIAVDLVELKNEKIAPNKQFVKIIKMKEQIDENFSKMFKILTDKESKIIGPLLSKGKFHSANIIFGQWLGVADEEGNMIEDDEKDTDLEFLNSTVIPMLLDRIKDLKSENESLKQKLEECGVEIESSKDLKSEEMLSKSININSTEDGLCIEVDKKLLRDGLVDKLLEIHNSNDE